MKIKVGMYARTCYGIGKVEEVNVNDGYEHSILFKDGSFLVKDNDIIGEPSFNPIDLIEVGDVLKIIYDDKEFICKVEDCGGKCVRVTSNLKVSLGLVKIKQILAKEQLEKYSFKVEEENV